MSVATARVIALPIVLALLLAPLSASPSAAQRNDRGAAAPTVRITINVGGCEGCIFTAASLWLSPSGEYRSWRANPRRVRDGQLSVSVPQARTRGLHFQVRDPSEIPTDYMTYVAMRYRGLEVGKPVTNAQAAEARRAFGCWKGTTRESATLAVRVTRFPYRNMAGDSGKAIRPFMKSGKKTTGTSSKTFRGALGAQDSYIVCGNL
jgi:hypothetical protein